VNVLVRCGRQVFEAIYEPSYRHSARRLDCSVDCVGWPSEGDAITALERAARVDGCEITIQAGTYPRGTRRRGDVLATTAYGYRHGFVEGK
jgi:hypothetical protein